MRTQTFISVVSLSVGIFSISSVHADCSALDQAIKEAPSQFSALKGRKDPDGDDMYQTSWTFGGRFTDCYVSYDSDYGYSMRCSSRASSLDDAKSQIEQVAQQIETCLKQRGPVESGEWKENTHSLTSATFTTRMKSFLAPTSSAQYDVDVSVSATCSVSSRTGKESCRAALSVDRKGDEK